MSVGPFRSTLEPFREFILSKRRSSPTWEEIAQASGSKALPARGKRFRVLQAADKYACSDGFREREADTESANRPILKQAAAEPRQIREKEKGIEWPSREEANQIIQ